MTERSSGFNFDDFAAQVDEALAESTVVRPIRPGIIGSVIARATEHLDPEPPTAA